MSISFPPYENNARRLDISVKMLRTDVKTYGNYFEFRRERVWSTRAKRSFIESLLHGLIIPEIFAVRKGNSYWIVDGQQRILTIIEFFADGFATPRAKDDPRSELIEPNKRCSQLAQQYRDKIDNTIVHISYIDHEMEEWQFADLYRRRNSQQSLIKSEKLWSYPSETNKRTSVLTNHTFWQKIYGGNQHRHRSFMAALYIMFLEVPQRNSTITEQRLRDFAAGSHDSAMTQDLVDTVHRRLDDINHIFHGTLLASMKEVIPVYQAAQLLEKAGFSLRESEKGCLTPWYKEVQEASIQAKRTYGQKDILSQINQSRCQIDFWTEQQSKILGIEGLCYIDLKRGFSKEDIRKTLERQKHLCAVCERPITDPYDGHHIIAHAKGGPTTAENCMVVHTSCHPKLHMIPGVEIELTVIDRNIK